MRIKIKTFSFLREKLGDKSELTAEVADGTTVGELLIKYGFNEEELSIVYVNKVIAEQSDALKNNDEVTIVPIISGG